MKKSTKLTLLFVLIFLIGVLGYVTYIIKFLNGTHYQDTSAYLSGEITFHHINL